MSDSPEQFGEGGLVWQQDPPYNYSQPVCVIQPYRGLTAAKVAALVNKQNG